MASAAMRAHGAHRLSVVALTLQLPILGALPAGPSPGGALVTDVWGHSSESLIDAPDGKASARSLNISSIMRREVDASKTQTVSGEAIELGSRSASDTSSADSGAGTVPSCFRAAAALSQAQNPDQTAFDDVYNHNKWFGSNSLSGPGSSPAATHVLCHTLSVAVSKVAAGKPAGSRISVLDAPSGDFVWMPGCLSSIQSTLVAGLSLAYQGVDVSSVAVGLAEKRRANVQAALKTVSISPFQQVDLADAGSLAKFGHVDILMSHDCLQHNPTANVWKILHNFNTSADLLVIDVDRDSHNQQDIPAGKLRFVDITLPPYGFNVQCIDPNTGQPKADEDEWFGIFKLPLHH